MKKSLILLISVIFIIINSCKKEKEDNNNNNNNPNAPTTDISAAQDNAIAEGLFADVFKQSTDGMRKGENQVGHLKGTLEEKSNCPTVTITPFDTVNWPKTIIVDFGTTNCQCQDGRLRRGKVKIIATHWFKTPNAVFTITPEDYYVNEYKVEGVKTVANNGIQDGYLTYSIVVNNAKITKPNNGGQILWNTNRVHQWIAGENTHLNTLDDEWKIKENSTAHGTSASGKNFNVKVIEPLYIAVNCHWIKKGKLEISIEGLPLITVDYGDGSCDANATATINTHTIPFVMN